jgi:hypothetical protein
MPESTSVAVQPGLHTQPLCWVLAYEFAGPAFWQLTVATHESTLKQHMHVQVPWRLLFFRNLYPIWDQQLKAQLWAQKCSSVFMFSVIAAC